MTSYKHKIQIKLNKTRRTTDLVRIKQVGVDER